MKKKTLIEYKESVFAYYVDLNQVIKREKNNCGYDVQRSS